jgi:hypothetical protein
MCLTKRWLPPRSMPFRFLDPNPRLKSLRISASIKAMLVSPLIKKSANEATILMSLAKQGNRRSRNIVAGKLAAGKSNAPTPGSTALGDC